MRITLVTSKGRVERLRERWAAAGVPWPRVRVVDAPKGHKAGSAMVIGPVGSVARIAKGTGGVLGTIG